LGEASNPNGGKINAYRLFAGKPEGKGPLGSPRHRLVDNIKINILEFGMVWTGFVSG
jgi:hypothetical protein